MYKTSIIILHYGSILDTVGCVKSLKLNNSDFAFQIIIVSNSPDDKLSSSIKKIDPAIDVIFNKTNLGFAEGNNVGIRKALSEGCRYLILLNNDTTSSVSMIKKLVDCVGKNPHAGLISPKIYFTKGFEYKNGYSNDEKGKVFWFVGGIIDWKNCYASHKGVDEVDKGQYEEMIPTDFATGCCMFIKKEVVDRIGLFDRKYFLYYEDVDYSIRAKRAGFGVYYSPEASVWHNNASSSGKPGSSLHIYYQTRNRLYFGYKYAPLRTKKSLFIESLSTLIKGGVKSRAVADYYLGNMEKGSL